MTKRTVVIIGSGIAGTSAAQTLRSEGFDGRIMLIGDEPGAPYDRTPLTKAYLRGESKVAEIALHPADFYRDNAIDLVDGAVVERLDVHGAEIGLAAGARVSFDAALLATGAAPRPLNVDGAHLAGVHLLRTIEDADALAADAASAGRVVVIGSGWIGCEAAASLRQLGKEVTVVAPEPVPLQRVLGDEIGNVFARLHTDNGVELRSNTGVRELRGGPRVAGVVTDAGDEIACDLVVIGVGAVPRDQLAVDAGLHCENGVFVDERLRTNGSNVYAAGDVAVVAHPRYGRLRVEHWASAKDHGAAAARSMLGSHEAYDKLPFFWSDQYDLGMEYTGRATPGAELVIRGDLESREFIAFWHRDGRIEAGMNVNVWDVSDEIDALIRTDEPIDLEALADPSVPLEDVRRSERVA